MRAEFTSIEPGDVPPFNLGPQICVNVTFLLCLIKQKLSLSASVPRHPQLPNPCPCVYSFLRDMEFMSPDQLCWFLTEEILSFKPIANQTTSGCGHQARWSWGSPDVPFSPPARVAASDPCWTTQSYRLSCPHCCVPFPPNWSYRWVPSNQSWHSNSDK